MIPGNHLEVPVSAISNFILTFSPNASGLLATFDETLVSFSTFFLLAATLTFLFGGTFLAGPLLAMALGPLFLATALVPVPLFATVRAPLLIMRLPAVTILVLL